MMPELSERRRARRRAVHNFLDYAVLAAGGEVAASGLARTLNVSDRGLLLETSLLLESGQALLLTLGPEEALFSCRGRVVHAARSGPGLFWAGVELAAPEESARALRRYMEALKVPLSQ